MSCNESFEFKAFRKIYFKGILFVSGQRLIWSCENWVSIYLALIQRLVKVSGCAEKDVEGKDMLLLKLLSKKCGLLIDPRIEINKLIVRFNKKYSWINVDTQKATWTFKNLSRDNSLDLRAVNKCC